MKISSGAPTRTASTKNDAGATTKTAALVSDTRPNATAARVATTNGSMNWKNTTDRSVVPEGESARESIDMAT